MTPNYNRTLEPGQRIGRYGIPETPTPWWRLEGQRRRDAGRRYK